METPASLGGSRAGEVRFGRWLGNAKVTAGDILDHAGRAHGLGTVGNGTGAASGYRSAGGPCYKAGTNGWCEIVA